MKKYSWWHIAIAMIFGIISWIIITESGLLDLSKNEMVVGPNPNGSFEPDEIATLIPDDIIVHDEPYIPQVVDYYYDPSDEDWLALSEALSALTRANQATGFYGGYVDLYFTGSATDRLGINFEAFDTTYWLPWSEKEYNVTGSGTIIAGFTGEDFLNDIQYSTGDYELVDTITLENGDQIQIYEQSLQIELWVDPCIIATQMNSDTHFLNIDDPSVLYTFANYDTGLGFTMAWLDAYNYFVQSDHLDLAMQTANESMNDGPLFQMLQKMFSLAGAWSEVELIVHTSMPRTPTYCLTGISVHP